VGPAAPGPAEAGSLRAAVADGLRLLRDVPLLRATTIATTLGQFTQGLLPVALPLLAVRLGHATSAGGWLLTALSGGGLAGALASDRLLARRTPRAVLIAAMAVFGICLALLAGAPGFGLALGLAVVAGVADGPILAATLTVRQQTVPADRYAQTVATAASIKTGSYALGAAATGLLAGVLTARQLVLVVAAGQLVALVPLLGRRNKAAGVPIVPVEASRGVPGGGMTARQEVRDHDGSGDRRGSVRPGVGGLAPPA
jgi:MFS family permease